MTAIGPTTFGVILWGALLGVFLIFCYEIYAVSRETGWIFFGS